MRVLVTGAGGFVGRHLVPRLVAEGHAVAALLHRRPPEPPFAGLPVELLVGDVTEAEGLRRALAGRDAVVHLAALLRGSWRVLEAVNVGGPAALVEACGVAGVRRLVHVSAVGAAPDSPSAFLRSRWRGEEVVRRSPLAWTIVRASLILGPGSGFGRRMQRLLRRPLPLPVVGRGGNAVQPVHVADVADLLALCLREPATVGRLLEIGGPERVALGELTRAFARAAGRRGRLLPLPYPLALAAAGLLARLMADPPATPDEVRMAVGENTCDLAPLAALGFAPHRGLDLQVRDSLAPGGPSPPRAAG